MTILGITLQPLLAFWLKMPGIFRPPVGQWYFSCLRYIDKLIWAKDGFKSQDNIEHGFTKIYHTPLPHFWDHSINSYVWVTFFSISIYGGIFSYIIVFCMSYCCTFVLYYGSSYCSYNCIILWLYDSIMV